MKSEAQFLLEGELANRWRIHPATLQRWRYQGLGPKFLKVGGRVLYPVADIGIYEAQHLTAPHGRLPAWRGSDIS
ncbi:MAG: DNA-binding protein [Alphaproteobacteria bacterium]|nr:MAG: DNA-binding protein [Alphaproteobacteria bacterium]